MWLTQVMAVLTVIERMIPLVERFLPGTGQGTTKAAVVTGAAVAVGQATLPGVNMQDAHIQALTQAKIAADVALANALQAAASAVPPPPPVPPS